MLRPERMRRLFIAAPKGEIDTIIRGTLPPQCLSYRRLCAESESPEELSIGPPASPGASDAASALIDVRAIEKACGIEPDNVEAEKRFPHRRSGR